MTITKAIAEVSFVVLAVLPKELAIPFKLSLAVLTLIEVSIVKMLHSLPGFDKIHEVPFIPATIRLGKDSKSVRLSLSPFTYVGVSFIVFPHACAILEVIAPLSLIGLSIRPCVLTLSVHLAIFKLALISASIAIFLVSLSMSQILLPSSFIDLTSIIHHYPDTFTLVVSIFAIVDCFFVLFESKVRRAVQSLEVDLVGKICLKVMAQLFVGIAIAVGGCED